MLELRRLIPDADVFLALSVEELAALILSAVRERKQRDVNFLVHLGNTTGELFYRTDQYPAYPEQRRRDIEQAYVEAYCWLEMQGLLVPTPDSNGMNGFRVLSRRAAQFTDDESFRDFVAARRLPRELLHPEIRNRVWLAFARGEYEVAVFTAMKAVEVAVRRAAGFGDDKYGVPMMREAFGNGGPLSDPSQQAAERDALAALFAGAIGSYKNPHSHRQVDLNDASEAAEIIMLASHLLRIVDDRYARFGEEPGSFAS
jgi:uncharacterized protein (TIGR02391 family)